MQTGDDFKIYKRNSYHYQDMSFAVGLIPVCEVMTYLIPSIFFFFFNKIKNINNAKVSWLDATATKGSFYNFTRKL